MSTIYFLYYYTLHWIVIYRANLIQFVFGQSFAELAINVIVEVDRHPDPDAVQKHKDEPKVLDLVVRVESRRPILHGAIGSVDVYGWSRIIEN
jgi:hypothetical protein